MYPYLIVRIRFRSRNQRELSKPLSIETSSKNGQRLRLKVLHTQCYCIMRFSVTVSHSGGQPHYGFEQSLVVDTPRTNWLDHNGVPACPGAPGYYHVTLPRVIFQGIPSIATKYPEVMDPKEPWQDMLVAKHQRLGTMHSPPVATTDVATKR